MLGGVFVIGQVGRRSVFFWKDGGRERWKEGRWLVELEKGIGDLIRDSIEDWKAEKR